MTQKTKMSRRQKIGASAAALVMVVGGGGVAYAFWSAPGGGTSTSVNARESLPVVVTQTASLQDLRPGAALPLSGVITNPNEAPVTIGMLNPEVTKVIAANGDILNPMDFTVTGVAVHPRKVPAKGSVTWSGFELKYLDTGYNQDAGKGATVTITYVFL